MRYSLPRPLALLLPIALGGTVALTAALPLPAAANVLPESALIVHVQPVSGNCEGQISNCSDVIDSESSLGQWEFLLFFLPIHWQQAGEPVDIIRVHCELIWPDSWQLTGGEFCSGWGQLGTAGPPYAFDVEWWDSPELPAQVHEMFLIARFVFTVNGPGTFGFGSWWDNTVELRSGSSTITTYPAGCFAQVAEPCEFSHSVCGYFPPCGIDFTPSALVLSAAPGGSAHGEAELSMDLCTLGSLGSLADWLSVSATQIGFNHYQLTITADASELVAGTYASWIRATGDLRGHCLPVEFRVEDLTANGRMSWSRIKSLYP